ncbi:Rhamnogalacturonate lyase [Vigna unguiculata]|uniref:Rhamnogalacturonate lyase n=1 Tax=Vigna unguiculata TaxID=3917 RepID=A0A4D6KZ58_VIGUN|nr:Rhamnogalacturonate lyase [Vigna unguiculata]
MITYCSLNIVFPISGGLSEFESSDVAFNDPEVKLHIEKKQITVQNGIIRVTFSNPEVPILGISYNGINNMLEGRSNFKNRGVLGVLFLCRSRFISDTLEPKDSKPSVIP